jgi:hypothetical protein
MRETGVVVGPDGDKSPVVEGRQDRIALIVVVVDSEPELIG